MSCSYAPTRPNLPSSGKGISALTPTQHRGNSCVAQAATLRRSQGDLHRLATMLSPHMLLCGRYAYEPAQVGRRRPETAVLVKLRRIPIPVQAPGTIHRGPHKDRCREARSLSARPLFKVRGLY
ncbi:uncharacterized protein PAN0_006d2819 [Moesziomyces antarcticus]|uniref:Uncharacterized protein n=1 Tax=Pseudozyma antarctica TaxID=84753 RepID=A0A081CD59_PSEA2|nr:uncharacterized protein PAN0_006d2819 [Moesziomyces antarcticus]GAK64605.1 hypothetical protein PAN0_006d2819 [Moesziomyces antarcticus]